MSDVPGGAEPQQPGGGTVLVIEPDILVRMTIAEYLRECGYKVLEGVSAEDALTVLGAGHSISVILAEVQLAGALDGFGLARRIRHDRPGIDVILTNSAARVAEKAGDLCDDGPLAKPYHPQEVIRRINLLRARRGGVSSP